MTLFFIAAIMAAHAQTTVCYNYDAAGNRTQKSNPCTSLTGEDPGKANNGKEAVLERSSGDSPASSNSMVEGKIVPNPSTGLFELRLNGAAEAGAWFELYDARGSLVLRQKADGALVSFDLTGKAVGNYFLYLRSSARQHGGWVVVKH